MIGIHNPAGQEGRRTVKGVRRVLILAFVALFGLGGMAPVALAGTVNYAYGTNQSPLGAGGWWRNPGGQQLTTALNFNRMSLDNGGFVRAIICYAYWNTVFHGVTLPCGWPGNWYTQIYSGANFLQVPDTYGHSIGMQAICENVNGVGVAGYCSWYY